MSEEQENSSVYSIDTLMAQTRDLAAHYRRTTGKTLPITGEIARFDAAKSLNLKLNDNTNEGYDAIGRGEREGLKILIKGRVIFDDTQSNPRISQTKVDGRWDRIVMVLFDDDYSPVEIYETDKETISEVLDNKSESKSKKRGTISVAQFKIIGNLVWTKEEGELKV